MRRAARPLTPEGAVLATVKDGLRALGVPFWRIGVGSMRIGTRFVKLGDAGLPDLVAFPLGIGPVFVECKSARGRLSAEQVFFRDACRAAGAVHVVCRAWEDLEPWVTAGRLRGGG